MRSALSHPDALLLAALRAAPRRYLVPPLPADAAAARAAGTATALAFAIEAARVAKEGGGTPAPQVQELFTSALADLIREALVPVSGDPTFQALVLRAQDAQVDEHVRLSAKTAADRRSVRAAVDAIAHPGKLRGLPAGAQRDRLTRLHDLVTAADWSALRAAAAQVLAPDAVAALERLVRADALLASEGVRRYLALCAQRGPLAGSDAAAAQGRASARAGEEAEQSIVHAFRTLAEWLDRAYPAAGPHRVVRSLRTPRGLPGAGEKAKEEWDAAIVRDDVAEGTADIVLLAEVKAAPAAATPDFSRLLRGLQRLAQADANDSYVFPGADGDLRVAGASLRALQPQGQALPPHVVYCCCAPPETNPQVLSAATRAVLLAESTSVAFARQVADGAAPPHTQLATVWEALTGEPRLRSALNQYETARAVRQAMLHPQDLLAAASLTPT